MAPPPSIGAYGGAGPFEMGLTWALAAIGTVVIFARVCVNLKRLERLEWDLFWAVLTYIACLVCQTMQTVAAAYGIGNHESLLTSEDRKIGSKWNWIGRIVGILAATLGKNTIIALLLRIQGGTHRRKAWFLHFVWVTNTLLCIIIVVVLCLRCQPIAFWWDKSLVGTCNAINSSVTKVLGLFQGSWMAASDVALALYPMFIFWDLQMSWKRKAGLSALLGGGLIAGVCGALKTVQVQRAYDFIDMSYNIYPLLITTLVECWMILILAAVPPLRHLFVKAFRSTRVALTRTTVTDDMRSPTPGSYGMVHTSNLPQSSADRKSWRKKQQNEDADFDNESEEDILPQRAHKSNRDAIWGVPANPGITITMDYNVSYEANEYERRTHPQ